MDFIYYIPRRLDESARAMVMFMLIVLGLFLGIVMGSFFTGIGMGVGAVYLYSKISSGKGRGYLQRQLYWNFPIAELTKMKVTPPSHVREFVG